MQYFTQQEDSTIDKASPKEQLKSKIKLKNRVITNINIRKDGKQSEAIVNTNPE